MNISEDVILDSTPLTDPVTLTGEPDTDTVTPHVLKPTDVVSVKQTVDAVEYIGVLGYVMSTNGTTSKVGFFHPNTPGEPAFVKYADFLNAELHFVGPCNPDVIPPLPE